MFKSIILSFVILFGATFNSFAADIYIMRGLFGFAFTTPSNPKGVYKIAADLEKQGHNVQFECWQTHCRKRIIDNIKKNPNRPFAIIGHSMGGNGVTLIGQNLLKYGIVIPYSVVIDAPVPKILTKNFQKVDNFYQFNDFRNPVLKKESEQTQLNQYCYRRENSCKKNHPWKGNKNHMAVADDEFLRLRIYSEINKL